MHRSAEDLTQITLQFHRQGAGLDGDVAEAEFAAGPEQPGSLGDGLGLVDEQTHGALAHRRIEHARAEWQAFGIASHEVGPAGSGRGVMGVTHGFSAEFDHQYVALEHPPQRLSALAAGAGQIGHQVAGFQPHGEAQFVGQAQPSGMEGVPMISLAMSD